MGRYIYGYYNVRNRKTREPIITVCVMKDTETGELTKGIAIKSIDDTFDKKLGRLIACNRAKTAYKYKDSMFPINRNKALAAFVRSNFSYGVVLVDPDEPHNKDKNVVATFIENPELPCFSMKALYGEDIGLNLNDIKVLRDAELRKRKDAA